LFFIPIFLKNPAPGSTYSQTKIMIHLSTHRITSVLNGQSGEER
jgi:hypothetical protein